MPLPSSTIGQNNFNPILAAQGMTNESSQFLVKNLSNLGASIADSISINNMRREAQEQGPAYAQQLQQGFGQIESGNIAEGLSQIYQTNAQFAGNPLLSSIGKEAARGAGWLANGQIKSGLQESLYDNRTELQNLKGEQQMAVQGMKGNTAVKVQEMRNQGWSERQEKDLTARQQRLQQILASKDTAADRRAQAQAQLAVLKNQLATKTADPLITVNRALEAQKSFHTQLDALKQQRDAAQAADDPTAWKNAQDQIMQLNETVVKGGMKGEDLDGQPFLPAETKTKIDELKAKAEAALSQSPVGNFFKGDGVKKAQAYQDQIDALLQKADEGVKRRAQAAQELVDEDGLSNQQQQPDFQEGQVVRQGGATYKYTNGNFVPVQ